MRAAENRRSIELAIDAFNQRDLDAVEATAARNYVDHERVDRYGPGFEATRRGVESFVTAFPDAHWQILEVVADDRSAAARLRASGTHEGEFMGIEPTGRRISWEVVDVLRFDEEGLVTDHWGYGDRLALLDQLGISREEMLAHTTA